MLGRDGDLHRPATLGLARRVNRAMERFASKMGRCNAAKRHGRSSAVERGLLGVLALTARLSGETQAHQESGGQPAVVMPAATAAGTFRNETALW